MTQKMQKSIVWLEKTYGSFEQKMMYGLCRLTCKKNGYPITFFVDESGLIGDTDMLAKRVR